MDLKIHAFEKFPFLICHIISVFNVEKVNVNVAKDENKLKIKALALSFEIT